VPLPKLLPANTRIKIPVELLKVTPAPVTVTAVTGNARYKTADGPFQPLQAGARLQGGETVLTGPRGSATYRFADGTVLTQQASSKLGFGRLAAYGKTGMVSTELSLDSGRLEASAARQQAPAGGFSVRTPVAVAGLRGTGFRLNVSEDGRRLANEVLEGAVAVAAQGREVRVEGGFGTVAEAGKPPRRPPGLASQAQSGGTAGHGAAPAPVLRLDPRHARRRLARPDRGGRGLPRHPAGRPVPRPRRPMGRGPPRRRLCPAGQGRGRSRPGRLRHPACLYPGRPPAAAAHHLADPGGAPLPQRREPWNGPAAEGAQGYLLQIAPTPEFDNGVLERRLPATLRHAETLPDGEWHWRLASLDEAGRPHLWGAHRAFRVQPLPGAPAGGEARADGGHAHFSWNTAKGAARYGIQVGGDAGLKDPVVARETDKTAIAEALKPGKYYWRARGLEADGQAGAWSAASPGHPAAGRARRTEGAGWKVISCWSAGRAMPSPTGWNWPGMPDSPSPRSRGRWTRPAWAMAKPEPGEYWLRVVAIGAEGVESPASTGLPVTIEREIPWWLPLCLVPLL
jgi:hypothetical protein